MTIRCLNCGADNRDMARFCGICSKPLPKPIVPVSPPPSGGMIHVPPSPLVPRGAPPDFPQLWSGKQPLVEGKVISVDPPRKVDPALMQKLALAGLLVLVKPILAILAGPMLTGKTQQNLRVEDYQTIKQRSIVLIGDPRSAISIGDWLAVWGRDESGDIVAQHIYNYTTGAKISLKGK